MGHLVPLAEIDHLPESLHRQLRLERSRLVIKARMQHPAVVACLMPSEPSLLLQQE